MYNKYELVQRGISSSKTKFGGNILMDETFTPREYLTVEEYPKVPLVIQVLYSNVAINGQHRRIQHES